VQASKISLYMASQGTTIPFRGRSEGSRWKHNHRGRRDLLKVVMSLRSKPPYFLRAQTLLQFTKHCPPFASSSSLHIKPHLNISIFLMNHLFVGKEARSWEIHGWDDIVYQARLSGSTHHLAFLNFESTSYLVKNRLQLHPRRSSQT
jgi:hypothetical protein